MDSNRVLSLARRIITQCVRDKRTFGLIIIVPSLVMALLGYFYTTGTATTINLGVVNTDHGIGTTLLSNLITDELKQQPNVTVIELDPVNASQALKDKKVDAVVTFGDNFTADTVKNKRTNINIVTEGTDQMKSALAARTITNATMTAVSGKLQQNNGSNGTAIAATAPILQINATALYANGYTTLDLFAPYLLGVIAFAFIFIFTGVTFLRERSFGTIERLLVSPLTRTEMILGYVVGFSAFAIIQSAIILAFAIFVLKVKIAGDIYSVVLLQLLLTIVSVNLGIFCSSFAKNEFQAVQFIPLLILPQVFLDGMFWPISTLPNYLQALSYLMPLTYANDALQNIMVKGYGLGSIWTDIVILLAFAVIMVVLSAASLNKQL